METTAQKLQRRERVLGITLEQFSWPWIVADLKRAGLDYILIDLEHGAFDWREIEGVLRMCDTAGLTSIVRVTEHVYHQISRCLDLGADGIVLPRTHCRQQLERAIEMMRLPPKGIKGVGGYDFSTSPVAERLRMYDNEKLVIVQIESVRGVSELDDMLDTGEVAGVIVGPLDLSVSAGVPGEYNHPDVVAEIEKVVDVCDRHRVSCGMYMMEGLNDARRWCGRGMNIIWTGSDVGLLLDGVRRLRAEVDGLAVSPGEPRWKAHNLEAARKV
jgi:2-dehydro-3-deoxyglucarate aldolase/4-hydroxy-2-oxoheptanedioate aldolase